MLECGCMSFAVMDIQLRYRKKKITNLKFKKKSKRKIGTHVAYVKMR